MSTYTLTDNQDTELDSADTLIIDEAGIDLSCLGEKMCASLEGLDPYRLAYDLLPKDGPELPEDVDAAYLEQCVANWVTIYNRDEEGQEEALVSLKMSAYMFLTVLARIGGYEEK